MLAIPQFPCYNKSEGHEKLESKTTTRTTTNNNTSRGSIMYFQDSTLETLSPYEQEEYEEWLDMLDAQGGHAEEQELVEEDDYDECPNDEDMEDCRSWES